MPLQATSGAASYDGFGGGVPYVPVYIENVFSTQVYTGAGTSNTILNYIDLATKGGLVWTKMRASPGGNQHDHKLSDSVTGVNQALQSNNTNPIGSSASFGITAFNSDGYTITNPSSNGAWNYTNDTFVSWTFRKQPKFFDVVTYSGSSSTQNIAHNLGSVPGCIIVKRTSGTEDWFVYHTSLGNTQYLKLNGTGAAASGFAAWNNTSPTSTQFTVLGGRTEVNAAGSDYVAYLFAHNAGGFGLTGTDNVISCGSFTTDSGGNATVTLGYEPAWLMFKCSSNAGQNWEMIDTMRGWLMDTDVSLQANSSVAEAAGGFGNPTATGFVMGGQGNTQTYIYVAIRRGPMKVPTTGTDVFNVSQWPGTGPGAGVQYTGFPVDSLWANSLTGDTWNTQVIDRLRKISTTTTFLSGGLLSTAKTTEQTNNSGSQTWSNIRFTQSQGSGTIYYAMGRAPSFFDVVCYTGSGGVTQVVTHNLGVTPQMLIVKRRDSIGNWTVYTTLANGTQVVFTRLNTTDAKPFNVPDTWLAPTNFTGYQLSEASGIALDDQTTNGATYVAYLFATLAGISKVSSYTGTGALQTINCGFTSGARWVMIKRTDQTGDWFVWDSSRGITSGNDPYIRLNSTSAEVTGTNYVDTDSTGFKVTAAAPDAINASGGTFIFMAIA